MGSTFGRFHLSIKLFSIKKIGEYLWKKVAGKLERKKLENVNTLNHFKDLRIN